MKSTDRQSDRLAELLGEIDPALIDEAIKTDTPEAMASLTRAQASPRRPKLSRMSVTQRRALIASVAALLALALILPVILYLPQGGGSIFGETTPPDSFVDPGSVIPPWRSGELKLTSLTYRSEGAATAARPPAFALLTERIEDTDPLIGTDPLAPETAAPVPESGTLSPESDTAAPGQSDPTYGKGENLTVSIMDNTKITSYMGEELIKLRPESGEHVRCPDVYFNITTNEYTCMSCRVLALMEGSDGYADAAARSCITECLLSFTGLWTTGLDLDEETEAYLALLMAPERKAYLAGRQKLTLKNLEIDRFFSEEHREHAKESLPAFEYPVVDIAEYGSDMSQCLFTLVSPRTGVAYGNYVCDLESGEITRIDKNCKGYDIPNLAAVSGICITDDYKTVVAAIPDFADTLTPILHTGLYKPVYSGNNVSVFSVSTGLCKRLLSHVKAGENPATPVRESLGVFTYVGKDGLTYAYRNDTFYAMEGELSRIIRDTDGVRYAVMRVGEDYTLYRLEGETAEPTPAEALADRLAEDNRYAVEGSIRIDLLSGERLTLWEGEPAASATTADGRYIYLYFAGEDGVLCLDVLTGERGYLSLSESFTAAAAEATAAAGEITYNLLLNAEENRLLMTYYREGQVVFDAAAFREGVGMAGGSIQKAIVEVVYYYTINGEPLRFYKTANAQDLLRLLAVTPYLDAVEEDRLSRDNNIEISIRCAEALIPYLEVWAHSAEVPDGVVESMLGEMTLGMFREYFQYTMRQYDERFDFKELDSAYGSRRDYAISGLSREFAANYAMFLGAEPDAETAARLASMAHGLLDAIVTEARFVRDYDLAAAYRSLICEITPTLTGMTYAEFIRSCRFMEDSESVYFVTTDTTAGDIRCGLHLPYDEDFMRGFMETLSFAEGEMEIKVEARLSRRVFMKYYVSFTQSLLEVGYAEDGKAYAVIDGYYAEITPEALETFKRDCIDRDSTIAYYPDIY